MATSKGDLSGEKGLPIRPEFKEFLPSFLESAREHIDAMDEGLLRLEKNGLSDPEAIQRISRNAHSLKGAAMTIGVDDMAGLCHLVEDVIRDIHEGRLNPVPDVFDALFMANDANKSILEGLASSSGRVPDTNAVAERLKSLMPSEKGLSGPPRSRPERHADRPVSSDSGRQDSVRVPTAKVDRFLSIAVELVITRNRMQSLLETLNHLEEGEKREASALANWMQNQEGGLVPGAALFPSIRSLLDQKALGEDIIGRFSDGFRESLDILSRLVDETQHLVMEIRMLPVSLLFRPFVRSARDLARERNKRIDIVIEGEETRIDKRAIEELSDPLLHLLRNAIDHGMEPIEERKAANKPETGRILLRAFQDIDKVILEVVDDGPGIDRDRVVEQAVSKGFLTPEEARQMIETEVFDLLFVPGFSTAKMVTDLSGRGIGMDVVKTNVEKLNGSVEVASVQGEGTRVRITLPLTLATTRAFLVRCSGHILAVPVFSAIQVLRVSPDAIETMKGREALYWQGEIIPCASMDSTLSFRDSASRGLGEKVSLMLLSHGGKKIAFQVDEVMGVEEIVMRNLGSHIGRLPAFSGSSILGTGEMALIVDVGRLFTAAQIKAGHIFLERGALESPVDTRQRILLVEDQMTTRLLEKSILEAAGFLVEAAEDGLAALDRLENARFDLVITDIQMPRMDGFTLTATLKKDDRYAHIPVVIVTSLEREEDRKEGLQVGADAFLLKKSFNQESLLQTIRALIG
jgi:two-component system, chemotaxis family, sensor kinase CheA